MRGTLVHSSCFCGIGLRRERDRSAFHHSLRATVPRRTGPENLRGGVIGGLVFFCAWGDSGRRGAVLAREATTMKSQGALSAVAKRTRRSRGDGAQVSRTLAAVAAA
jgi:hypothetical protein